MITKLEQQLNWGNLNTLAAQTVERALNIQSVPAPTFEELERAEIVANEFVKCGLQQVVLDDLHNVYGLLPGRDTSKRGLLVTAHTDTVFDRETPLTAKQQGPIIFAPGLGDNSIGVAAMLTLIDYLRTNQIALPCDVWFVATTREEGLGNCGGMRTAFERLQTKVAAVINLEGLALGHVYNAGIAVRRLKISVETDGGHSWLHFGQASAIHILMTLGAQISALTTPQKPRTTYNIGMIEGGRSINSIASEATMLLDMRSEENAALAALEKQVRVYAAALNSEKARISIEVIGDRPSGSIANDHLLVETAMLVLAQVGLTGVLESGSTDGNIPLAAGCPTVTVGVTRGGNAHRIDEFVETAPVAAGLKQIILLTLAAAELASNGSLH